MDAVDRYLETRLFDANRDLDVRRLFQGFAFNYGALIPVDKEARILDLGCGLGHFLDYLASEGYTNRCGVDISRDCALASGTRHPVVHVSDAGEFLRKSSPGWDLIVMRHVLAHLAKTETVEFIGKVRAALNPGGRLVIETFNGALPTSFYTWANDFTHQQVFTEASLRQVLLLGEFTRVDIRPFSVPMFGTKGALYATLRSLYVQWLKVRYVLERGAGNNPSIYSKFLLAVAAK